MLQRVILLFYNTSRAKSIFSLSTAMRPHDEKVNKTTPMRKEPVNTLNLIQLSKW